MAQKNLHIAKQQKLDEFYTQIGDIERECSRYREQFKGKVIFLNCDDPVESNFWRYFALNFTRLGLKKLIATHFDREKSTYKLELTGDMNEDGTVNDNDIVKTPLKQNGDFRSDECIEILKEAAIVVTNPPFSLFREYLNQLIDYGKQFLIIGNTNALTYKEVFALVKENQLRTGYTNFNVGMFFHVPGSWEKYHHIDKDGRKMARVSTSCWFTNLDVKKHNEYLPLYKTYSPEDYPQYFNYDAIEVSKAADIPVDYDGKMGVPITFIDKYNPEQFEIIGSSITLGKPMAELAPKGTYTQGGPSFYIANSDDTYRRLYHRVVIKHKKKE